MATNRDLRSALLKKLGVSPQALSLRVQRKKSQTPMSTEDATYLIAHDVGIKIDRYLTTEQVDKVRSLHGSTRSPAESVVASKRAHRTVKDVRPIQFPGNFNISNSLLPAAKLAEAREMATVYAMLYVLENSMRELIKQVMFAKYVNEWWDTELTTGKLKAVHSVASSRMKSETVRRWHQTRGAHPIDYVDLGNLSDIILGKQDHFFPDVLGADREWFIQFMRELEPSRNVVCHMNPLSKHNIQDVKLRLQKWDALLMNARAHISPSPAGP